MTTRRRDALRGLVPVALVGIGGFTGAVARFALGVAMPAGGAVGTLAANVLGSFALGTLSYRARRTGAVDPETRLLVGTGFLSSFTTFSTFAVETTTLGGAAGVGYVAATLSLGLLAVLAGRATAEGVA